MSEGELTKRIISYVNDHSEYEVDDVYGYIGEEECTVRKGLTEILAEAKKELLTFKEFVETGMMMDKKPDFSDIYSVYISRKIEKWFGSEGAKK